MSVKVWAFGFAFLRWVVLVALALVPSAIVVVTYRWWKGRELWSMDDLPVAAEVTLALAWLAMLTGLNEIIYARLPPSAWSGAEAAIIAGLVCAVPVGCAYVEIERLRRVFGRRRRSSATVPMTP